MDNIRYHLLLILFEVMTVVAVQACIPYVVSANHSVSILNICGC